MAEPPQPKRWRYPRLVSEHVFDKLWQLDLTFAEFQALLDGACLVIEELALDAGVKQVVLLVEWRLPLHVVVVVDDLHREERLVTVYEPSPMLWTDDFRTRR